MIRHFWKGPGLECLLDWSVGQERRLPSKLHWTLGHDALHHSFKIEKDTKPPGCRAPRGNASEYRDGNIVALLDVTVHTSPTGMPLATVDRREIRTSEPPIAFHGALSG